MLVAACAKWHEAHDVALSALQEHPRLVAHAALEAYSTLTRLPSPQRIDPPEVAEFLRANFTEDSLVLPANRMGALVQELLGLGVSGGAVYDALIALTAAEHGAELLTRDRRAEETYRRCGAKYRLLG